MNQISTLTAHLPMLLEVVFSLSDLVLKYKPKQKKKHWTTKVFLIVPKGIIIARKTSKWTTEIMHS